MVKGMSSTSSILGRPFAGKPCSWHGLWEQHCRQPLGGSVGCATLQLRGPGACRQRFSAPKSFSVSVRNQDIEIVEIGQS